MAHRVLILDKTIAAAGALKVVLERDARVHVALARDDRDALDMMSADPADIVLVDHIAHPTAPGLIAEIARTHPETAVIVLSDRPSAGSLVALTRAGAGDYVLRPCSDDAVYERVRHALGRQDAARARADDERRRLLRRIAQSVGHEVNSPLTSILGAAEIIRAKAPDLDEGVLHDLDQIVEQSLRIGRAVSRLADLHEMRRATPAPPTTHRAGPSPGPDADVPRRTVLLVDDNDMIVSLLRRMYQPHFRIVGATSAAGAVETVATDAPPDVVLVDMFLPDADGADLVARLRRLCPTLPIVLMAGYDDEEQIALARRNGACAVLYKPFHFDDFRRAVLSAGDARRDHHEACATVD